VNGERDGASRGGCVGFGHQLGRDVPLLRRLSQSGPGRRYQAQDGREAKEKTCHRTLVLSLRERPLYTPIDERPRKSTDCSVNSGGLSQNLEFSRSFASGNGLKAD
jgi:hypothetical protein